MKFHIVMQEIWIVIFELYKERMSYVETLLADLATIGAISKILWSMFSHESDINTKRFSKDYEAKIILRFRVRQ